MANSLLSGVKTHPCAKGFYFYFFAQTKAIPIKQNFATTFLDKPTPLATSENKTTFPDHPVSL